MKKIILIFALGLGLTTFAQDNKATQKKSKHDMEQRKNMTPEERHQKHMEKLTKELSLTADQQQKVSDLVAERDTKVKALMDQKEALDTKGSQATAAEKNALKKQLMDQKKDFEAKMKEVLTADQFAKWKGMRDEGKDKMMKHYNTTNKKSQK